MKLRFQSQHKRALRSVVKVSNLSVQSSLHIFLPSLVLASNQTGGRFSKKSPPTCPCGPSGQAASKLVSGSDCKIPKVLPVSKTKTSQLRLGIDGLPLSAVQTTEKCEATQHINKRFKQSDLWLTRSVLQ